MSNAAKIEVKNVFKIFGDRSADALDIDRKSVV